MRTLNQNDKMTREIVSAMQTIYETSEDVRCIYLMPFRMSEDGSLFDEQYLLVDLDNGSKDSDIVIDAILDTDRYLEDKGISTATTFYTDEDLSYLIKIPKGGF